MFVCPNYVCHMFLFTPYDPMAAVSGKCLMALVLPFWCSEISKPQWTHTLYPRNWIPPLLNLQAKMDWDALLHWRWGEHSVEQLHLGRFHLAGKCVAARNDHACSRMHVGGLDFSMVGAGLIFFCQSLSLNVECKPNSFSPRDMFRSLHWILHHAISKGKTLLNTASNDSSRVYYLEHMFRANFGIPRLEKRPLVIRP